MIKRRFFFFFTAIPFSSISWIVLANIPGIESPEGVVKLERASAVINGEPNKGKEVIMIKRTAITKKK